MNKITVMVSSTSKMKFERLAFQEVCLKYDFIELVGSDPYNTKALGQNPYTQTIKMAKDCNLYILILGEDFGFTLKTTKKSATETEFDAAFTSDPTKILVFQKADIIPENKQKNS